MRIAVVGTGYVGLGAGTCFAETGHSVTCVDGAEAKLAALRAGKTPIYEPGLEELLLRNSKAERLFFTSDLRAAVRGAEGVFIAVGTPQGDDGNADLRTLMRVAHDIAAAAERYTVVVNKSTVPVGTAQRMQAELATRAKAPIDVVSNPEFLKEGAAIDDFMRPDRIVIGAASEKARALVAELYAPFNRNHGRMLVMDVRSSEFTKYAANAMLATKISFMNELANIAERVGVDIEHVRIGIGSDPRIGYSFIYPGCGYGGSCFPKDVRSLERTADDVGYDAQLLRAVEHVNDHQKKQLFAKINTYFGDDVRGRKIAV